MNISVVVPVLNEEKSIDRLIRSMQKQTVSPTEVIIVDGGSVDQTVEKIQVWQKKKLRFHLELIEKQGANRSAARNIGIQLAKSKVVALTDAGCEAKGDWLELLTQPFIHDKETQVVAGFYDPAPRNWFEDILADYTAVRDWNFDEHVFLPSSRSLALKKDIWQEVGGYPEDLDTCEDLVFAEKLKRKTKHWKVVKEAQVIWLQPTTLGQLSHKVFGYASGDLKANFVSHVKKIYAAFWRVCVLLCVAFPCALFPQTPVRIFGLAFFALYILGSWAKHFRMLRYPMAFLMIPIVQIVVDTALVQALLFSKISKSYKS